MMANQSTSPGSLVRGLRVGEFYAIFKAWDLSKTTEQNLTWVAQTDVMGSRSRFSQEAFLSTFKRRFDLRGPDRVLVDMAKKEVPFDVFRPVLLWHTARKETVLRLFLTEWLYARFADGTLHIRAEDVRMFTANLASKRVIPKKWSKASEHRVASALLTMAKEAGLVKGHVRREFTSYHLPEPAFLYLLHAMSEVQPNAHAVLNSPDWRMFLMDVSDVERELFRLHQYRRIRYEVAGSLAQLTLPFASAAAFVEDMAA